MSIKSHGNFKVLSNIRTEQPNHIAETTMNYEFSFDEVDGEEPLIIDTDISIINWHFGFSVATLKTVINFKNIRDNREIQATGIRKSGGGDEMNNLKKSLKDGTHNYLKEYQKP